MKEIYYEDLYRNAYNREWDGWKDLGNLMKYIESIGTTSWKYPESRVKHALVFLNSYLLERRVKEVLNLNFLDKSHEAIMPSKGNPVPDFIDNNGKTYELKERWSFDEARRAYYYNADYCLVHLKSDNCLYYYYPKTNNFEKICYLRADYINIKKYPFEDRDLGIE